MRGEKGINPTKVEYRLGPCAARLKKALGADEFFIVGHGSPPPKYFFQKFKNFNSSRQANWGRMADWFHKEADAYKKALY